MFGLFVEYIDEGRKGKDEEEKEGRHEQLTALIKFKTWPGYVSRAVRRLEQPLAALVIPSSRSPTFVRLSVPLTSADPASSSTGEWWRIVVGPCSFASSAAFFGPEFFLTFLFLIFTNFLFFWKPSQNLCTLDSLHPILTFSHQQSNE